MNTKENELIAEFLGFQKTKIGWFDSDGVINLPYTKDNTFDELLFDKSWDWIMPCVGKISNECEEPEELDKLKYALLTNNLAEAFLFITDYILDLA